MQQRRAGQLVVSLAGVAWHLFGAAMMQSLDIVDVCLLAGAVGLLRFAGAAENLSRGQGQVAVSALAGPDVPRCKSLSRRSSSDPLLPL